MLKLIFAILLAGLFQQVLTAPGSLDSNLLQRLGHVQATTNVLVTMKDRNGHVLDSLLRTKTFVDRRDRLNSVASSLKEFAADSQKDVLDFLSKEQAKRSDLRVDSLWTTNQVIIRGADLDLLQHLSTMSDISDISEEQFISLDDPIDLKVYDNLPAADEEEIQWGVKQIQAPEVWAEGNRGEGIVICTIDTGVRVTHEALKDNFVGAYGWFDPAKHTPEPNDQNGHGTHTTGNIAGTARNVGVAPGAQWAACKGCATSMCSQLDLLGCGQFVACPTDTDGNNADCSKAPHLVSNSWGGGRGNTWYAETINVWRAGGIIPLFSQGNSGPACGSANSPGDEPMVIGVGATDIANTLSYFSSVGPTTIGSRIKPDVAAPGSNVFSAHHLSDTAYASMSGTSMASPHAAGAVALLLAEHGDLSYEDVYFFLTFGTEATTPTNRNCNGIPEDQYPNHHVGHGRINAHNSVAKLRRMINSNDQ